MAREIMIKTLAAMSAALIPATAALAEIAEGRPDIVLCKAQPVGDREGGMLVFHISGIADDGLVIYQTLGKNVLSVIVEPDGRVREDSFVGCAGMTLDELREAGQTREF